MDFYTVKKAVEEKSEKLEKEYEAYYASEEVVKDYRDDAKRPDIGDSHREGALQHALHGSIQEAEDVLLGDLAGLFHQIAYEGRPVGDWPAKKLAAEGWTPAAA